MTAGCGSGGAGCSVGGGSGGGYCGGGFGGGWSGGGGIAGGSWTGGSYRWLALAINSVMGDDEMVKTDLNTFVTLLDTAHQQAQHSGSVTGVSLDCYWKVTGTFRKKTQWRYRTSVNGLVYVCTSDVCIPRIPPGCKVVKVDEMWLPSDFSYA